MATRSSRLVEHAPAKVNLTLAVLGRRDDGYHLLESLVAFAGIGDRLTLVPGSALSLSVRGEGADDAGPVDDNLVLKSARELASEIEGLSTGRFTLDKRLPVAAGLGGGSSDAAAALRLLAQANGVSGDDRRLYKIARRVGADVPVCVDPRPRLMRGIGEILSVPLTIPRMAAVLINPGVALPTKDVFAALGLPRGVAKRAARQRPIPPTPEAFVEYLTARGNDLEAPAISLQPVIARVLEGIRGEAGCRLARMSGSGATCFGLFTSPRAANAAARKLATKHPRWWVKATAFGSE